MLMNISVGIASNYMDHLGWELFLLTLKEGHGWVGPIRAAHWEKFTLVDGNLSRPSACYLPRNHFPAVICMYVPFILF